MEAKKPTKKRKASLDTILSTVQRGFADLEGKMERGFAAVAEDIADIRSKMATKDDIAAVRKEMQEGFLAVNRRLDQIIQMQLDEHAGRIKKLETAVFPN
jgi:hypothetical protein